MSSEEGKDSLVDDADKGAAVPINDHRFGIDEYSDLVLRVDDVSFHVHKAIIAQHSSVIREMIDAADAVDGVIMLELPSVVPSAVYAVIVSLYDESVSLVIDAIVVDEAAAKKAKEIHVARRVTQYSRDAAAAIIADGFAKLRALAYFAHAYDFKRAHAAISAFVVTAMAKGTVKNACKLFGIAEQFKIDVTSLDRLLNRKLSGIRYYTLCEECGEHNACYCQQCSEHSYGEH
jgi:hypothetical protein